MLLDHMIVLFLISLRQPPIMFSIVTAPPHSHQRCMRIPFLSASSSMLVICCLFDNDHSDRCEVIAHGGFDLHFLMICDVEHLFHVPLTICYVFEKCSIFSFKFIYSFTQRRLEVCKANRYQSWLWGRGMEARVRRKSEDSSDTLHSCILLDYLQ